MSEIEDQTWDPVPWFIRGGKHKSEQARLLAYLAAGGKDGVVTPGSCKIHQSDVPDSNVVMDPGAVSVVNRKSGATAQAYAARKTAAGIVAMTPTTASGPRTDLIVASIEDPQYPPAAEPTDWETAQFVFTRVIEGVPAGTRRVQDVAGHANDSAVTLARVTRPANTGTVTNAHITDLRVLTQPRSHRELLTHALVIGEEEELVSESETGEEWPNVAGRDIVIPEWATAVKVVATLYGVRVPAGNCVGRISARLGLLAQANAPVTQEVQFDTPGSTQVARETWGVADTLKIPAALRGTSVYAHFRARIISKTSTAARPSLDSGSSVVLDLQFVEETE